jgi:hypothetical protein
VLPTSRARIEIAGGTAAIGGNIGIYPGAGSSQDGIVEIQRAILNNGGTAGQVLLSAGSSAPAVWGTPDYYAGPGTAAYGNVRNNGVASTFSATDYVLYLTANVTATLPAAAGVPEGRIYILKATSTGCTLAAAPGDQIDASSGPWSLGAYETRRIIRVTGVGASEWLFI